MGSDYIDKMGSINKHEYPSFLSSCDGLQFTSFPPPFLTVYPWASSTTTNSSQPPCTTNQADAKWFLNLYSLTWLPVALCLGFSCSDASKESLVVSTWTKRLCYCVLWLTWRLSVNVRVGGKRLWSCWTLALEEGEGGKGGGRGGEAGVRMCTAKRKAKGEGLPRGRKTLKGKDRGII